MVRPDKQAWPPAAGLLIQLAACPNATSKLDMTRIDMNHQELAKQ